MYSRVASLQKMAEKIFSSFYFFRSLSDTRQHSETDEILRLREALAKIKEQASSSKRNEQLLTAERNQLEEELGAKKKDNSSLQSKLDQKVNTFYLQNYVSPPNGRGTYWFWCRFHQHQCHGHAFLSAQYLMNQWLNSYQIVMHI